MVSYTTACCAANTPYADKRPKTGIQKENDRDRICLVLVVYSLPAATKAKDVTEDPVFPCVGGAKPLLLFGSVVGSSDGRVRCCFGEAPKPLGGDCWPLGVKNFTRGISRKQELDQNRVTGLKPGISRHLSTMVIAIELGQRSNH